MVIDKNLIDKKINNQQKKEFTDFAKEDINIKKPTGFKKFMISPIGYFSSIALVVIGIAIFFVWMNDTKNGSSNGGLITFSIILAVVGIIAFSISLKIRDKIIKNSIQHINMKSILIKWFSYYDIKEDAIKESSSLRKDHKTYINTFRKSPSDADIYWMSNIYSISYKGITSHFVGLQWHWKRAYEDSDGRTRYRHHYMKQIYMFEDGFDKKWDNFEFDLTKRKTLLKRKVETLENIKFNKMFNYKYNNPVKLRLLFTVLTQELLIKKFEKDTITLKFRNGTLITTAQNNKIASDFTPFELNFGKGSMDEERMKNLIANDLLSDFTILMHFMGHSRLLFSLYKHKK